VHVFDELMIEISSKDFRTVIKMWIFQHEIMYLNMKLRRRRFVNQFIDVLMIL
jgi:hypothetical protein